MRDLFLADPNKIYQKSFENYALTYRKINDKFYFTKYKKALENFQDYLNDLHNYSKENDLLQGEVITSTFWLIDKKEAVDKKIKSMIGKNPFKSIIEFKVSGRY